MAKETGVVKKCNDRKGFGFISRDQSDDHAFVHFKAVNATGRKTLRENDCVEFFVVKGDKGFQAEDVTVIS